MTTPPQPGLARALCAIQAAVAALPGAILVLAPQAIMGIYGLQLDAAGAFAARVQGALMLGLALIFWSARDAGPSALRTGVLAAGLLINALQAAITALATISGVLNAAGWPAALLHAALALGFAYALWVDRRASA